MKRSSSAMSSSGGATSSSTADATSSVSKSGLNVPPTDGTYLANAQPPLPAPRANSVMMTSPDGKPSSLPLFQQPPQLAYGWFVPHPPPYGPYFWPCLPPGYALVPAQTVSPPPNLPTRTSSITQSIKTVQPAADESVSLSQKTEVLDSKVPSKEEAVDEEDPVSQPSPPSKPAEDRGKPPRKSARAGRSTDAPTAAASVTTKSGRTSSRRSQNQT